MGEDFRLNDLELQVKKNINNVKIIEPLNIQNKKEIPAFVFFSGLGGKIPSEIYNNFMSEWVNNENLSIEIR